MEESLEIFLRKRNKRSGFNGYWRWNRFCKILAEKFGVSKIVPFHRFSTAHIPLRPIPIEVAAARQETYSDDSRKPKKVTFTNLEGDLLRRDFTVNAMAMSVASADFGKVFDPHNGLNDLKNKINYSA